MIIIRNTLSERGEHDVVRKSWHDFAPNKFIPRNIVRSLFGKLIYKRGGGGRYRLPLVFVPF